MSAGVRGAPQSSHHNTSLTSSIDDDADHFPRGDFGLIGLAVMGQNLILNAADHGFNVVAFNRTVSKVDRFLANEAKGKSIPLRREFEAQNDESNSNYALVQENQSKVPTQSKSLLASSRSPAA
jgi:NAD binding domain of 6-phosphogluconate dehydrogenase